MRKLYHVLKERFDDHVCAMVCSGAFDQPLTIRCAVDWLCGEARHYTMRAVCRLFGHGEMIDDGWATPDSGGECLTCSRCGYTWKHIYY